MIIWKKTPNIQAINQLCQNCAVSYLGIEFIDFGDNWLSAIIEVDERTTQPFGLLHGGVSALLAETLGSAAALLCCDKKQIPVGKTLSIKHIKPIRSGTVTARATPIRLEDDSQIWEISQFNQKNEICAISRLEVCLIKKG